MYHNQLVHKLAVEQAVTSLASRSISRAYCHRTPNAQAVLVFQKQEYLDAFSWHLKQSKLSSREFHTVGPATEIHAQMVLWQLHMQHCSSELVST